VSLLKELNGSYRKIFDSRSPEEMEELSEIKRFMECVIGDPEFRDELIENAPDFENITHKHGIAVDPQKMLPLFESGHLKYQGTEEEEARWPLSVKWGRYMKEMLGYRDELQLHGSTEISNPSFHGWRGRQIARSDSELGASGKAITHPIVAYELCDGCSVGCWFCGISADKFRGAWPYTPQNAELWRGMLNVMVETFGDAAQTGFCYWATDPMDNPDYDKFIRDHWEVVGFLPQTTTAVPLKDIALTRRVLALFDEHRCVTNRFSILTTKILRRVHQTFTAKELMGVELVPQMKGGIAAKANAGRAMLRKEKLRQRGKSDKISVLTADHSTIACVSGFLVNMLHKNVKMVSPTRASAQWPLGYRIYDEGKFETADDFRTLLGNMIRRNCMDTLRPHDIASFRGDLTYTTKQEGFELAAVSARYTISNNTYAKQLGSHLASGEKTVGEVYAALIEDGADVFLLTETLRSLYSHGLLDDDPASTQIKSSISE